MKFKLIFLSTLLALTPTYAKNLTSKIYSVDTEGTVNIVVRNRPEFMVRGGAYEAMGATIETSKGAFEATVLSNGTAMFIDSDTRVVINDFIQEPFAVYRADPWIEPSISRLHVFIPYGTVAVCTNQLIVGTKMTFATHVLTVNVRSARMVIVAKSDSTTVYLLEGDVTVKPNGAREDTILLRQRQWARVTKEGVATLGTIEQPELSRWENEASIACESKRRVFFNTTGKANDEITAMPVVPAELPINLTISPSKI